MSSVTFQVRGSRGDIYDLNFRLSGTNLNASCSCQAGQNRLYCKHRFALMDGDVTALHSNNLEDVKNLQNMMKGTDLEAAYQDVREAEAVYDVAKQRFDSAKKALALAMYR